MKVSYSKDWRPAPYLGLEGKICEVDMKHVVGTGPEKRFLERLTVKLDFLLKLVRVRL